MTPATAATALFTFTSSPRCLLSDAEPVPVVYRFARLLTRPATSGRFVPIFLGKGDAPPEPGQALRSPGCPRSHGSRPRSERAAFRSVLLGGGHDKITLPTDFPVNAPQWQATHHSGTTDTHMRGFFPDRRDREMPVRANDVTPHLSRVRGGHEHSCRRPGGRDGIPGERARPRRARGRRDRCTVVHRPGGAHPGHSTGVGHAARPLARPDVGERPDHAGCRAGTGDGQAAAGTQSPGRGRARRPRRGRSRGRRGRRPPWARTGRRQAGDAGDQRAERRRGTGSHIGAGAAGAAIAAAVATAVAAAVGAAWLGSAWRKAAALRFGTDYAGAGIEDVVAMSLAWAATRV